MNVKDYFAVTVQQSMVLDRPNRVKPACKRLGLSELTHHNPEREESMNLIVTLFQLKNETVEKKLTIYGAQAAFFLQLSAIPFVMTLLNVFQFVSPSALNELMDLLNQISTPAVSDIFSYIINDLYVQSSGALISISLLSAIWSSSKGIYAIEQGLNEIYGNDKKQGLIKARIYSFVYMILLIVMLLFTMIVLMFGSSIQNLIGRFIPPLYHVINLFLQFRLLVFCPVLILFFMCLYTFYPGRKLRFRDQFWGAAFSAAGWILCSVCYEFYLQNISSYSRIYGSMGAVLLLLLWIYFFMCIMLFGAELNDFLHHRT